MAKYMQDSTDIQINEVSGTDNINFSFKSGNSIDTKIGDLAQLETTDKSNIVGAINEARLEEYSTTEQVIGKWVDGKPIYRKTFSFNLGSTINTWSTIGTIANIKLPIRFYGMFWNGTVNFSIPRAYDNEDVTLYCDTGTKLFREQHNYSYANNLPVFAIIEYTKTTD